jgi:hypothetical protein
MTDDLAARAAAMEARIRTYFDGCNAADVDGMVACFTPDAVHYFPPGMYGGAWRGARTIAERWEASVAARGSAWTIDRLVTDPTSTTRAAGTRRNVRFHDRLPHTPRPDCSRYSWMPRPCRRRPVPPRTGRTPSHRGPTPGTTHTQRRAPSDLPVQGARPQGWRWRESNPRPLAWIQDFSGRSLLQHFSAPMITQASHRAGPSHGECRRRAP